MPQAVIRVRRTLVVRARLAWAVLVGRVETDACTFRDLLFGLNMQAMKDQEDELRILRHENESLRDRLRSANREHPYRS